MKLLASLALGTATFVAASFAFAAPALAGDDDVTVGVKLGLCASAFASTVVTTTAGTMAVAATPATRTISTAGSMPIAKTTIIRPMTAVTRMTTATRATTAMPGIGAGTPPAQTTTAMRVMANAGAATVVIQGAAKPAIVIATTTKA